MRDDLKERVQAIQISMVESARLGFSESELDDLRVVIRLTVEFHDHLYHGNSGLRDIVEDLQRRIGENIPIRMHELELSYVNASTLSGIEFFSRVNDAYKVLAGSTKSGITWRIASVQSLEELFISTYHEFAAEVGFLKKCRLLLDLFKIQIVFAGVSYD